MSQDWQDELTYRAGKWLVDYVEHGFDAVESPTVSTIDQLRRYTPKVPIEVYRGIPYTLLDLEGGLIESLFKSSVGIGDEAIMPREYYTSWSRSLEIARDYANGRLRTTKPKVQLILKTILTPDQILLDNDALPRSRDSGIPGINLSDREVISYPGEFRVTVESLSGVAITEELFRTVSGIGGAMRELYEDLLVSGVESKLSNTSITNFGRSYILIGTNLDFISLANFVTNISILIAGTKVSARKGKETRLRFSSPLELLRFLEDREALLTFLKAI